MPQALETAAKRSGFKSRRPSHAFVYFRKLETASTFKSLFNYINFSIGPRIAEVHLAMSLKTVYERFLASPNPLSLTESASINYIPTLKTFAQPASVIRHLEDQNKNEVRKKAEKIIAAVEAHNALSLDVETTLEFISGGGAYLPGLENFVTDRIVTFPTVSPFSNSREQNNDFTSLGPCGKL